MPRDIIEKNPETGEVTGVIRVRQGTRYIEVDFPLWAADEDAKTSVVIKPDGTEAIILTHPQHPPHQFDTDKRVWNEIKT